MSENSPTPLAQSAKRRRIWHFAWVRFFICCALLLLAWLTLEEQRQWRLRKWSLGTELDEIMTAEMGHTANDVSGARGSDSALDARRKRLKYFEVRVQGASISPRYAGWRIKQRFTDDPIFHRPPTLQSWELFPPPGTPPRGPSLGWWVFEALRECVSELSILALGAGVALLIFAWRSRRSIGQLILAVAIIAIIVKAFEPDLRWSAPILDDWVSRGVRISIAIVALMVVALPSGKPRQERGYCLHCNYNLTANQSGVCPECGRATAAGRTRQRDQRLQQYADSLEMMTPSSQ